jgi:hypothetical protein
MDMSFISRSRTSRAHQRQEPVGTNGICQRFHDTVLNEFDRIALRKKIRDRCFAAHTPKKPLPSYRTEAII